MFTYIFVALKLLRNKGNRLKSQSILFTVFPTSTHGTARAEPEKAERSTIGGSGRNSPNKAEHGQQHHDRAAELSTAIADKADPATTVKINASLIIVMLFQSFYSYVSLYLQFCRICGT